jgi:hypothetical protein
VKGLCGLILHSIYTVGANGRNERRLTGPLAGGPGSTIEGFPNDDSTSPVWWPDSSRFLFLRGGYRLYEMNADGTCERPFGPAKPQLTSPAWRPGTTITTQPLACVELRARAAPARGSVGLRGTVRFQVTIENDGTLAARSPTATLRLNGAGYLHVPAVCRAGKRIVCAFPPLAPGAAIRLELEVTQLRPGALSLRVDPGFEQADADPASDYALASASVLDCDIAGTDGPDTLRGTPGRDTVCGLPGPDDIRTGTGNDRIGAGSGDDRIVPGPGRDTVDAGDGRDWIDARDGQRDVIACGPGRDTVLADRVDRVDGTCERVTRRP